MTQETFEFDTVSRWKLIKMFVRATLDKKLTMAWEPKPEIPTVVEEVHH